MNVQFGEIIIGVFVLYYLLYELESLEKIFVNKRILGMVAIFFLITILSVVQSRHITFPFTSIMPAMYVNYPYIKPLVRIMQLGTLLLFSLCIAHYVSKKKFNEIVYSSNSIASGIALFLVFIFLINLIFPTSDIVGLVTTKASDRFVRVQGFFQEPLLLSMYLAINISLFMTYVSFENSKKNKAMLLLQCITLFLTFSRAGWLSLLILIITAPIIFKKEVSSMLSSEYIKPISFLVLSITFFLLLVFSGFITDIFYDQVIDAFNPESAKFWSTRLRLEAYSIAVDSFQEHPLFGVGAFNFHFYGGMHMYTGLNPGFYFNYPEANNLILTILSELGMLGMLFLLLCIIFSIRFICRAYKKAEPEDKCWIHSFIITSLCLFTIFMFFSKITLPFLWFFIGLAMSFFNKFGSL